jgi:hypothetical protein
MPSNQCTNSLMELSFAVGNMFGAAECVKDDYRQLNDILNAWECSKKGKVKEELDIMKDVVAKAVARGGARGKTVPVTFCQELWFSHNRLVNSMNIFDDEGIGLGARGPVPPMVKGPDGVAVDRSLEDMRGSGWPKDKPDPEAIAAAAAAKVAADAAAAAEVPETGEQSRHYRGHPSGYGPARGMGYGDEERRKRWYPARV